MDANWEYTISGVDAETCVHSFFSTCRPRVDFDVFYDPFARDRPFTNALVGRGVDVRVHGAALEPPGTRPFLSAYPPSLGRGGKYHVVGMPPFGYGSQDARKYLMHAARFADTISFVMPASWATPRALNYGPPDYDVIKVFPVARDALVTCRGTAVNARVVFVIWQKKDRDKPVDSLSALTAFAETQTGPLVTGAALEGHDVDLPTSPAPPPAYFEIGGGGEDGIFGEPSRRPSGPPRNVPETVVAPLRTSASAIGGVAGEVVSMFAWLWRRHVRKESYIAL